MGGPGSGRRPGSGRGGKQSFVKDKLTHRGKGIKGLRHMTVVGARQHAEINKKYPKNRDSYRTGRSGK